MHELSMLGAELIRIKHGTKVPVDKWKETKRRVDDKDIDEYFNGYNVAAVAGNSLVFIDVEGEKKTGSANGVTTLDSLQKGFESLPMCPVYSTPSGGFGYIFRSNGAVPFVDLGAKYGVEMRTGLHYSLVPESYYDGLKDKGYSGHYDWSITPSEVLESEGELPFIPDWLVGWFASQIEKETEQTTGTNDGYDRPDYEPIIATNIWLLNPDMPYSDWWSVMAVCHRAGCYDMFCDWSKTAKIKYTESTANFIKEQWNALSSRTAEAKLLGINTLMRLVRKQELEEQKKPQAMSVACGQQSETHCDERTLNDSNSTTRELCNASGLIKEIELEVAEYLPKPFIYRYLIPQLVVSTLCQRRIAVPKAAAMGFHALYGPSGSMKTVVVQAAQELLRLANKSTMILPKPASAQALQRLFSEQASRFYGNDEAIQNLVQIYGDQRRGNPVQLETANLMLEYFGSPLVVAGQANKDKDKSVEESRHPRLCWLIAGVTAKWSELLRQPSFIQSGMASRLAPWRAEEVEHTFEAWEMREHNGIPWSAELAKRLEQKYGTYLCASSANPSFSKFELAPRVTQHMRSLFERCETLAAQSDDTASIWRRMRERALWYAGVHAWGRDSIIIEQLDMAYGVSLCEYHVSIWKEDLQMAEQDEFVSCMNAVLSLAVKRKGIDKHSMHRFIQNSYRGREKYSMRCSALKDLCESGYLDQFGSIYMPTKRAIEFVATQI